jgi:predicted enzyme related to lactoylglutathione lyase
MGVCHDVRVHLSQIRLVVSDFPQAFAFYRDVLGLTPQSDVVAPPYAAFRPESGSSLALHERADLAARLGDTLTPGGGDRALVALRVDDLAACVETVTERGARVLAGPVDYDGRLRCAYLRDPEGNLIELQEWLS